MNFRDVQFGFLLIIAPLCAVSIHVVSSGGTRVGSLPSSAVCNEVTTSYHSSLQNGRYAPAVKQHQAIACDDIEPLLRTGGPDYSSAKPEAAGNYQAKACLNIPFRDVLRAIALAESNGRSCAEGDGGSAVGAYQIRPIYLNDVNRICGRRLFKMSDRYLPHKSRQMTEIYLRYYGRVDSNKVTLDKAVRLARIHNGGPEGYKKEATKKYGAKLRSIILSGDGVNSDKSGEGF